MTLYYLWLGGLITGTIILLLGAFGLFPIEHSALLVIWTFICLLGTMFTKKPTF